MRSRGKFVTGVKKIAININNFKIQTTMPLSIKKVLISEPVDPGCAALLTENGVEVTSKAGLSKDELIQEIKVCILLILFIFLRGGGK